MNGHLKLGIKTEVIYLFIGKRKRGRQQRSFIDVVKEMIRCGEEPKREENEGSKTFTLHLVISIFAILLI